MDDRDRADLLDDRERLGLHPELRLEAWERMAKPIAALVDAPLETLGSELSRSVLVDPRQPLEGAAMIVARLVEASSLPRPVVMDGINALICVGVELPPGADDWMPQITAADATLAERIRSGFAALAHADLAFASRIGHESRGDFSGGLAFGNDIVGLLGYVLKCVRLGAVPAVLDNALHQMGERLEVLCASGQLDEAALLWLGRVVFHRLGHGATGDVATRMHDLLWRIPGELDQARREAGTRARSFPLDRTLVGGRYRIDHHLRGTGSMQLHRGVEVASGDRVFIALDGHVSRQSLDDLRTAVSPRSPGLFELADVGLVDNDHEHHWAVIERVPDGDWLPAVVEPAPPSAAYRKAVELGVSCGRILLRAAQAGIVLAQIRPHFMWARRVDGRYEVTGLSVRAFELFDRHRGDMFTHPLFDVFYRAPEARMAPDDRSVSYALGVMVAEWVMGYFPLHSVFGHETTDHDPIIAPAPLRALLERALEPEPDDRPGLAELVAELDRLDAAQRGQ